MSQSLVWDSPVRLFHWLFAAGFTAAATIALVADDDSRVFPYHAVIGLAIALMVCLRILWGTAGSKYARFSSFGYGPRALAQYLKGALFGGARRYAGHNPGSAYATIAMFVLMLGLAVTGIMLGRGYEGIKDVHEVLAYVMPGVVAAHVLGVVLHMLRHRENLVASMIHGRKATAPGEGIPSSHRAAAASFLILAGAWTFGLVRSVDPVARTITLPIVGAALQIGDVESDGAEAHENELSEHHHDAD